MHGALRARSIALAVTLWSSAALAVEPEANDPQAVESARWEFVEGTAHFQSKRWSQALRSFEHSLVLSPSPNTELMIARVLKELGRRVDAAGAYANAEAEAKRRVLRGESKYAQTADAAKTEGAAVRAQLGTIKIHVVRPSGVTLTVDQSVIPLSKEGDATLLRDPGMASVAVTEASGAEQRQTITVQAGNVVQMDFAAQTVPPPVVTTPSQGSPPADSKPVKPSRPEPREDGGGWAVPAALVSGGVTLAGLGVFIGFGASSQATYDALNARCGPGACGPEDRAEADSGKTAQTIANVGLGVSAVALVATIVFVVVALSSER